MKRRSLRILLVIIGLLLAIWVVWFPLQRFMAIKKFEEYAAQQGADTNLIVEKFVGYDIKSGGYIISVKYSDDSFMTYRYQYNYWTDDRDEGLILDRMTLKVSGGNPSISDEVCKYPAIDY
ncbi:MAG: DUF3139 domain-containing protein [Lachnospiraceae bacterium]|nr:DUF3139 domain-containing protein [Lachnospiraceae bacterium]